MKKTIKFIFIMLFFTAASYVIHHGGLPEPLANWLFPPTEEEKAFAEAVELYDRFEAETRGRGIPVQPRAPLPDNWQDIIRAGAVQYLKIKNPKEICIEFADRLPRPEIVFEANPLPRAQGGWEKIVMVKKRLDSGKCVGSDIYSDIYIAFFNDGEWIFFNTQKAYIEMKASGGRRFYNFLEAADSGRLAELLGEE